MAAARRWNLMANRASIKATAEETDGAFGMIEFAVTPGAPPPSLHVHSREDECLYVLEGRLVVTVAHEERIVEAGGFVFMPRGAAPGRGAPGPFPAPLPCQREPGA